MENANKLLMVKQYLHSIKDHAVSPTGFAGHLIEKYGTDVVEDTVSFQKKNQGSTPLFPEGNTSPQPAI